MSTPSSAQDDGRIDHVSDGSYSAKLAGLPRPLIVEGLDFYLARAEQAGKTRLTTAVAPRLTHDACRDRQRVAEV